MCLISLRNHATTIACFNCTVSTFIATPRATSTSMAPRSTGKTAWSTQGSSSQTPTPSDPAGAAPASPPEPHVDEIEDPKKPAPMAGFLVPQYDDVFIPA